MTLLRNSLLTLAATAMFGLSACTDDSVTPTTNKNYTPTTSGSFWVYENRTIDSSGAESEEATSRDSVTAGEKQTIDGELATALIAHSTVTGSTLKDTTYTYTEGSKVYNYLNISNYFPIPLPFQITSTWVNSVDFNATAEWKIFEQTLPPMELPLGMLTGDASNTTKIKFTPKVISKGKKSDMKAVTFEGQTVQAQEVITTTGVSLSEIVFAGIPTGQSIDFDIINKSYYVENIGLVQSRTEPTKIALPLGYGTFNQEGRSQILVKHSIK